MKARIMHIGTIENDMVDGWGFDCEGRNIKDFIREDTQEDCCLGWTLSELKHIENEVSIKPELRKYIDIKDIRNNN